MKRRKKYNPNKALKYEIRNRMRSCLILWSSFSGDARLFKKDGNELIPTHAEIEAITRIRHKWTLHIAAFGLDHSDKIYMKSETIQSNEEYTHSELCDFLNKEHYALIESVNPQRRIGCGWIATIGTKDMTEDQIYKWFERIGLNEYEKMSQMPINETGADRNAVYEAVQ